jgi:phage shock protein E
MNFWKFFFGGGNQINFAELMQNGAQIIDVRTKAEYESGHIAGSLNIPLQVLESNLSRIKKDRPVITCCASGMRSSSAKSLLEAQGYEAYNGGGWASLSRKLG